MLESRKFTWIVLAGGILGMALVIYIFGSPVGEGLMWKMIGFFIGTALVMAATIKLYDMFDVWRRNKRRQAKEEVPGPYEEILKAKRARKNKAVKNFEELPKDEKGNIKDEVLKKDSVDGFWDDKGFHLNKPKPTKEEGPPKN